MHTIPSVRAIISCTLLSGSAIVGVPPGVIAQPGGRESGDRDSVMQVGEELTYNVSFASFDLGRVKISVTDVRHDGPAHSFEASARIETYKGVPFVSIHTIYESRIDPHIYSRWFRNHTKSD